MKRVSKAILITAGLVVMLVAGAVLVVNHYVESPAARLRIQAQLSEAIGVPMEITKASFGWSGLQLAGVRIPSGSGNFLEASSFTAEYRLLPLLTRRLVLRKMTLENPKVVWAQNAEGKWVLPVLPDKGQKEKLANAGPKKTAEERGSGFAVEMNRLVLINGTIDLLDAHGQRVALATEVAMDYTVKTPQEIEGTLTARNVAWGNFLRLTDLQSPLKYAHGELSLPDLHADVTGGKIQGSLTVQTEDPQAPFSLKLNLDRLELGRLATEAGWPPDQASGALGGEVEWHGVFRDLDRAEAKGHLRIAGGHFQQLDLFQTIGQVLQIPQLADLRDCTGAVDFTYGGEKTMLDRLLLETGDLSFETKGTVKTDGKMNLTARLSVSEKIVRQLPTFVRSNLGAADARHRYGIDFNVTGNTDKPKTDLVKRIIGTQVNGELNDLLGSVLGSGEKKKDEGKEEKKKEKKKKKNEAPAPAPGDLPNPAAPNPPAVPEPGPAAAPAPAEPAEPAAPATR